jgi:hypothetical protein
MPAATTFESGLDGTAQESWDVNAAVMYHEKFTCRQSVFDASSVGPTVWIALHYDALRNETKVLSGVHGQTSTIESIADLNVKGELTDAEGREARCLRRSQSSPRTHHYTNKRPGLHYTNTKRRTKRVSTAI